MNSVVFSILLTLLNKRKVTREFLSDKYEVSPRTVSRYMDVLIQSGVPVLSSPGVNGGYMIPDDYKLDKNFLDVSEKNRIVTALKATAGNFDDNINAAVIEKLFALQPSSQTKPVFMNDYLIIDAGSWGAPHAYRNKIDTLTKAVTESKTILIKYVDRHEMYSEREVHPYNLVLKQGVWYLYGWCLRRQGYRLFKFSRITYMCILDKPFVRRSDADVYDKLSGQFDVYDEIDLEIEFSCTVLPQIEEWLGFDAIYEEGLNYKAAATVHGGNDLVAKIMSFGSSVKIISPSFLKEEVLIECRRILENV